MKRVSSNNCTTGCSDNEIDSMCYFDVLSCLHQVEDSVRIAEALLSDLSGFKVYMHFCDDLLELLRAYEQEQFEDWSRDILSELADPKSGIRLEILQQSSADN